MNTIAATTNRIPRAALIALGALVVAFALLMIVRMGVLGGSETSAPPLPVPTKTAASANAGAPKSPAKPQVVLLPNLPPQIASKLRYSKVVVVSLYVGQAPGDHQAVTQARIGARAAGAGFVAINVGADKTAGSVAPFAGPVTLPALLVVRRPGRIVTQIPGQVESAIVAQAARNAGARR